MAEQNPGITAAPLRNDTDYHGGVANSMRPGAASQAVRNERAPFEQPFASTLDAAPIGSAAVVRALAVPSGTPEWAQWLEEIGFIPGERVMVMARGLPGADPLVVRVGNSTFALRRAEAACIQIGCVTP